MTVMIATPPPDATATRRHDLDWLRVIAFLLLIFYHVGMFYVTWDWHVKSAHVSPFLQPTMSLMNPWRLALLFFISGVAVRFASDKTAPLSFARSRVFRLGVPLAFGVAVVVAPQSYFQLLEAGEIRPGFLRFWGEYLWPDQTFSIITPTWNHLWYVAYLLTYTLLILPFSGPLRCASGPAMRMLAGTPIALLLLPAIPFVAYELTLTQRFPTTHLLWGDWGNHAHRFSIFLLGYLAAKSPEFWRSAARAWPFALGGAVLLGAGFFIAPFPDAQRALDPVLGIYYAWWVILTLLGLAQRFLNRPSRALAYLTGAVFCWFILHQTVIVVFGYWLTRQGLPVAPEFLLLTLVTLACCAAAYEIVRRVPPLRPLFGAPHVRRRFRSAICVRPTP